MVYRVEPRSLRSERKKVKGVSPLSTVSMHALEPLRVYIPLGRIIRAHPINHGDFRLQFNPAILTSFCVAPHPSAPLTPSPRKEMGYFLLTLKIDGGRTLIFCFSYLYLPPCTLSVDLRSPPLPKGKGNGVLGINGLNPGKPRQSSFLLLPGHAGVTGNAWPPAKCTMVSSHPINARSKAFLMQSYSKSWK